MITTGMGRQEQCCAWLASRNTPLQRDDFEFGEADSTRAAASSAVLPLRAFGAPSRAGFCHEHSSAPSVHTPAPFPRKTMWATGCAASCCARGCYASQSTDGAKQIAPGCLHATGWCALALSPCSHCGECLQNASAPPRRTATRCRHWRRIEAPPCAQLMAAQN